MCHYNPTDVVESRCDKILPIANFTTQHNASCAAIAVLAWNTRVTLW
jgi:hypothetical protein